MKGYTRLAYCFVLSLLPYTLMAQNLVPNPDFEAYNSCPYAAGSASYDPVSYSPGFTNFVSLLGWVSPLKVTTPDYFNTCAPLSSGVQVPETNFGHQSAHSGNGYAGIIAWDATVSGGTITTEWREYMQTKLLQPMQAGAKYCVSFYVNATVSQKSGFNQFNYVGIDDLGVNFSTTQQLGTNSTVMNLTVDVINKGKFVTDTANWTRIKGIYTAKGNEEWMTIGYFKQGIPSYQVIHPDPGNTYRAYYFMDDVSVVPITGADTLFATHDTVSCVPTNFSIDLSVNSGNEDIAWNTGAKGTDQISVTDTGTYWCTSTIDCFTYIDTFRVRYEDGHSLNLGRDTFNCYEQPITISANNSYSSYSWSTGATTKAITVTKPGNYILTVTTPCGIQKDTINVDIRSIPPPPTVSDTMICQYVDNARINVGGEAIRWYTAPDGVGNFNQPAIVSAKPTHYTYYVSQSYGHCESGKAPLHIEVKFKPADKPEQEVKVCEGEQLKIGEENEDEDVQYAWNTGEFVCCIRPAREGIYTVDMHNVCGTARNSYDVQFSACNDCVTIPSVFTPNYDGLNDKLAVFVACPITGYHLRIYNKWGGQVFDSQNPSESWDGTYHGTLQEQGVYIYTIEYNSYTTNRSQFLKGNVTLIR